MSELTLLNLEQPKMTADYESNAPTGISLQDIEGMEQFLIGLKSHTGQVITPAKAMRASAVLACMRILSEDLSALRLPLYRRVKQPSGIEGTFVNTAEEATDHPLYSLVDVAPNDYMTSMELREHILFDMMLAGNFFVLKNSTVSGEVSSLWPLQAMYCSRRWQEVVWNFTDPLTGTSGTFGPDEVWRGTILSGNALDGQALTLLAREAIGLLLAAEEQGARLFKHGVQTDIALVNSGEAMDQADKDQLRAAFQARHGGSMNAFMPLLLESGMDIKRIGLTAQESQYIEVRKFQIEDIARIFRVPEVLLGNSTSGKSSTYASAEQFFQSYTKHTLTPWAVRIEQTMNRDLLTNPERAQYFFRHDFNSLLRGDTAARYASYGTGIDKGFISPAQARNAEGMPWVPGLDYFNKPQAPAPGADQQDDAKPAPTDSSGKNDGPFRRVAEFLYRREHKALASGQSADSYYAHIGGFIEDLTGADLDSVLAYCEMRRSTADKFSPESQAKAVNTLISISKKVN